MQGLVSKPPPTQEAPFLSCSCPSPSDRSTKCALIRSIAKKKLLCSAISTELSLEPAQPTIFVLRLNWREKWTLWGKYSKRR